MDRVIGGKRVISMEVELTTMCALFNEEKVLMINRVKSWNGWAFPGGHLEQGESITNCIKREMLEETGLMVDELNFKGITNIVNVISGKRHIVFNFTANSYQGQLRAECNEGKIKWISKASILKHTLAEGMEYRFPLFMEEGISELYIEWTEELGYVKVEYR